MTHDLFRHFNVIDAYVYSTILWILIIKYLRDVQSKR